MDIFYLPRVSRTNFTALEALLHTKRNYSDWLQQAHEMRKYWEKQGCTIRPVEVNPEAFRRYLDAKGFPYDRVQLLGFAEWVGKAQESQADRS